MKYELLIAAATYYEGKTYLVPQGKKGNCLFEYDTVSDCMTEICSFSEYEDYKFSPFSAIIYSEGFIYLITSNIDSIIVYNTLTTDVSKKEMPFDRDGMIISAEKAGDNIYMFDAKKPSIYLYNVMNNCFTEINSWVKDIKPYVFDNNDIFFRKQVIIQNGYLMIPFCNANAALKLSVRTSDYEVIKFAGGINGYSGIVYKNGEYWLFPRRGNMNILCCDEHLKVLKRIKIKDPNKYFRCFGVIAEECSFIIFGVGTEKIQIEDKEHIFFFRNNMELLYDGNIKIYTDVYEGKLFMKPKNGEEQSRKICVDMLGKDIDDIFKDEVLNENARIDLKFLLQYVVNR